MKAIKIAMIASMLIAGIAYAKTIDYNKKPANSNSCTAPAKPVMKGVSAVCLDFGSDYSIAPVANATSYVWSVKNGYITSRSADNTHVHVKWRPDAESISVKAVNSCGSSGTSTIIITYVIPHCGL